MSGSATAGRAGERVAVAARVVAAAGLVVDAVVHLQLAPSYQAAAPGGVGQGNLFRAEAVVAVLASLLLLARPRRWTSVVAFTVAASALAAVLLYRYVDIGAFGPIPSMYEPLWFAKKAVTAVAEAVAALAAIVCSLLTRQSGSGT